MTDPGKKNETVAKPNLEEEVITNEADDLNLFIRKTQLQNQILKKLTENMESISKKEVQKTKYKS